MRPYSESEFEKYAMEAVSSHIPEEKLIGYAIWGYQVDLFLREHSNKETSRLRLEYNGKDCQCKMNGLYHHAATWGHVVVESINEAICRNDRNEAELEGGDEG